MKQNNKFFMSGSTSSLLENIIPKKIFRSGDYKNAEHLLKREDTSSEKLVDLFYLLGNKFFSSNQKIAAELSWKESRRIFFENRQLTYEKKIISKDIRKIYTNFITMIFIIFIIIYFFLLVFFKREALNFQLESENFLSEELSLWDEWWYTGRSYKNQIFRRYGEDELWFLIDQTFGKIFRENQIPINDVQEKLKRWLEFSNRPNFREGSTDYYSLTARGLFEAREFDEALSTLNDSLKFAEKPQEFEKIYQDLGTIYYYRGYKLNSNGLAKYNINDVKESVRSYEKALLYGEDPYLYGNLGWGYYLLGDFNSSIVNSLKALKLRPDLNYVRMNLGIAYLKTNDYEMSFSAYESLLKYNAETAEYEGGIRDLMELQMESPGFYPFTNFVLGQLFWQQGLYKKSESSLKKFISIKFPNKYWKNKARMLLKEMRDKNFF